jgi:hypothetical protein
MGTALRAAAIPLCALLMSGCATGSKLYLKNTDATYLTAGDIVDHIACEIEVAQRDVPEMQDSSYLATINLTIQADDSFGATPSFSLIEPLKPPDTSLTNIASFELTGTGQRVFVLNASIKTDEIEGLNNGDPVDAKNCGVQKHSQKMLRGDLELRDIIQTAFQAYRNKPYILGGVSDASTPLAKYAPSFAATIQFTLKKSVSGVGPTWILHRFKGPGGSNGILNGFRTDTDKLVITFSPVTARNKKGAFVAGTPDEYGQALTRNQNLLTTTILQSITPTVP